MKRYLTLLAGAALLGACYHATINIPPSPSTGVAQQGAASGQSTDIWAHSFVYGLVPPSTVDAKAHCPNGVSKVETQMTFVQGVVAFLTASLYTPMTITVTCAGK